jgi:hypothetical protein
MILLWTKKPVPNSWFLFPFPYKNVYSPTGSVLAFSYQTCTPTKFNWDNSFETAIREPVLYKLLLFQQLISFIYLTLI